MLLAQFSAFPFNGADLYEELKTSMAILSTGLGRWVHGRGQGGVVGGVGVWAWRLEPGLLGVKTFWVLFTFFLPP